MQGHVVYATLSEYFIVGISDEQAITQTENVYGHC